MQPRTVLIGLDGATFSILDGLMAGGVMPFLREIVDEGASAVLETVIPALTPPAWTSMMTGRSPGAHGVFDFFRKDAPDDAHVRMLMSPDVRCETVWAHAKRNGMRATVLNFPMTFPPVDLDGHLVPGWIPARQLRLGCTPPGLFDRIKALPDIDRKALGFDLGMEEKAIEGCRPEEYEDWIAFHIRREEAWFGVVDMLMREEPSELTTVLFDGVDKLQHLFWPFIDPAFVPEEPSEWEARIRARCLDYYRRLDGIIAGIVERAGPGATVVLASDHGFGPQTSIFFVNAWLEQRGYLAWAKAAPGASETATLGAAQAPRMGMLLDWERTTAYVPTPSGNGIHIVRAGERTPHGVRPDEYGAFRDRLIEELRAVAHPETGDPLVTEIWTREEVFAGPQMELAPDLTLVLRDGGLVSVLSSDVPVVARDEPRGTHRPDGIVIARGPGLRAGLRAEPLSILDVAPLLLYSLGLPVPSDYEGRMPEELFEPAFLRQHPVRRGDAAGDGAAPGAPAPAGDEAALDPESEAEIMRRLRALGYLE